MKQEVPDFSSSNGRVNYHTFLLEEIWKVKSITWSDYQFNSRRRKTTRSCCIFTIGHWIYNRMFYKDDLEKACIHQGKRKKRSFWVSNVSFQVALKAGLWLYLQSSITFSDAWKTLILVDCIAAVTSCHSHYVESKLSWENRREIVFFCSLDFCFFFFKLYTNDLGFN